MCDSLEVIVVVSHQSTAFYLFSPQSAIIPKKTKKNGSKIYIKFQKYLFSLHITVFW